MKNHVTVTIGGQQYAILAAEGEEYVRKVAAYVDGKLKETMEGGKMALVDGAVLTAMNIADEAIPGAGCVGEPAPPDQGVAGGVRSVENGVE